MHENTSEQLWLTKVNYNLLILRDSPNMTLKTLKRKLLETINVEMSDHIIYRAQKYLCNP